ncbi:HTH domain-containing protein [Halomicroarcula sp. GCM10025709]|uniref:HTH domain-containing protein n=1 Tax=Haloarcula TaxID=2237 RepID=UPI0024C3EC79|nr:HTH domain-containing protein [Halomicroarcula sp. YJ-61-S]
MAQVPADFAEEFAAKGETFFAIAELLYANPDRQYTQGELADRFDCSRTTISNHTSAMSEWLERREDQTTFAWDPAAHNPAATEGVTAVRQFYSDLWKLLKKHSNTAPGTFAIMGAVMFLAGVVLFGFYVGFSLSITADSGIPLAVYLVISFGSFVTGVIVTFLSPFQAWINGLLWPRLPENPFGKNE